MAQPRPFCDQASLCPNTNGSRVEKPLEDGKVRLKIYRFDNYQAPTMAKRGRDEMKGEGSADNPYVVYSSDEEEPKTKKMKKKEEPKPAFLKYTIDVNENAKLCSALESWFNLTQQHPYPIYNVHEQKYRPYEFDDHGILMPGTFAQEDYNKTLKTLVKEKDEREAAKFGPEDSPLPILRVYTHKPILKPIARRAAYTPKPHARFDNEGQAI